MGRSATGEPAASSFLVDGETENEAQAVGADRAARHENAALGEGFNVFVESPDSRHLLAERALGRRRLTYWRHGSTRR